MYLWVSVDQATRRRPSIPPNESRVGWGIRVRGSAWENQNPKRSAAPAFVIPALAKKRKDGAPTPLLALANSKGRPFPPGTSRPSPAYLLLLTLFRRPRLLPYKDLRL